MSHPSTTGPDGDIIPGIQTRRFWWRTLRTCKCDARQGLGDDLCAVEHTQHGIQIFIVDEQNLEEHQEAVWVALGNAAVEH
jgi:hypothetical protein